MVHEIQPECHDRMSMVYFCHGEPTGRPRVPYISSALNQIPEPLIVKIRKPEPIRLEKTSSMAQDEAATLQRKASLNPNP